MVVYRTSITIEDWYHVRQSFEEGQYHDSNECRWQAIVIRLLKTRSDLFHIDLRKKPGIIVGDKQFNTSDRMLTWSGFHMWSPCTKGLSRHVSALGLSWSFSKFHPFSYLVCIARHECIHRSEGEWNFGKATRREAFLGLFMSEAKSSAPPRHVNRNGRTYSTLFSTHSRSMLSGTGLHLMKTTRNGAWLRSNEVTRVKSKSLTST